MASTLRPVSGPLRTSVRRGRFCQNTTSIIPRRMPSGLRVRRNPRLRCSALPPEQAQATSANELEKQQVLDLQVEPAIEPAETSVEYVATPLGQLTMREVWEDLKDSFANATVSSVGSVAAVSGGAALALVITSGVMSGMHLLPVLPETMQVVGLVYCALVAREHWTKERLKVAPSPLGTISEILGTARKTYLPASEILSQLPKTVDENVGRRLQQLAAERDQALAQLDTLRKKEADVGRAVAEKEALEAVAVRLAGERDAALSEVTALRTAVNAMTDRMKAIEAMLAQEVQRLQDQNKALETVALQLADERDKAVTQMAELQASFDKQREEDKKVLEMLATQLIEERNTALKEVEEVKLVVARLMQASESDSGLPPEMETFIKSRVRAIRSQFVDVNKPYAAQAVAVDSFVSHLAEEYGAPRDWTRNYIQQFLDASASGHSLGVESVNAVGEARKLA